MDELRFGSRISVPVPNTLREFWFPLLLALVGVPPFFIANSLTGNGRRGMLTISALFFFAAVLTYIWGDPVRGTFAYLRRPNSSDWFELRIGSNHFHFPVANLKDGINVGSLIHYSDIPNQPMDVWVRKTWWSGLRVKITLRNVGDGKPVLVFDNNKLQYNDSHFDVNYDDYSFEIVSATKVPVFQFVISKDYRWMYLSARVTIYPTVVMVINDNGVSWVPPEQAKQPEYRLERIFKYPSYIYQGERN